MSTRTKQKQANRMVREQQAAEARRRRTLWTTLIAIAAVAIGGLIAWGVLASQSAQDVNTPKNATSDGTGLVVGSGPTKVDIYVDFLCPYCNKFEKSAGTTIDQLVADKKITVNYRPVAILNRASTTNYSTRSAAAAGCASDFGLAATYVPALFAQQPPEGSAGLSDDTLIEIGGTVGLVDPAFAKCVRAGTYQSWANRNTDEAAKQGYTSTPTVLVNGKKIEPTADALTAAVNAG